MDLVSWAESWRLAALLRGSGEVYLLVNAAHIFGIALLIGAIVPLDLSLIGIVRKAPLNVIGPFLSSSAAVGLAVAITTGTLLWSVKPNEYLANPAFLAKLALLTAALLNIVLQHVTPGWRQAVAGGPVSPLTRTFATVSAVGWIGVLIAGRWIGFL